MELRIEKKNVYGRELLYVRGDERAINAVRKLTGNRTVTERQLRAFADLGFRIVFVREDIRIVPS